MLHASAPSRTPDSIFKQPRWKFARANAPAHRAGCLFMMCPSHHEGKWRAGRRKGWLLSLPSMRRKRVASRRASSGDFWRRDRTSGTGRTYPDPAGFRLPSSCPPSSRERQSFIVSPDDDPSPPGSVAANHARERRASFHFRIASRSAPHE